MEDIIYTERLKLRKWIDADFIPFSAMNKDADVMKYYPSLLNEEETAAMMKRINSHFEQYSFGVFAIEKISTGEFIGYTGFMIPPFESFFTPCIEIGWRLKKVEWNKSYATEAAKACLQYGFDTLQFQTVYSFTAVVNSASERVMNKVGMIKQGEFNHPNIAPDNTLCRHVLYKIENKVL
ncbi:MAG: GNAT family N-acetyltransferase [Parafilimonas sp.]